MNRRRFFYAAAGLALAPLAARYERVTDALVKVAPESWTSILDTSRTVTVAHGTGSYFRAGDILRVLDTGENVRVTAIQHDTFTLERGLGSNHPKPLRSGDEIIRVGMTPPPQPEVAPRLEILSWLGDEPTPRITTVA